MSPRIDTTEFLAAMKSLKRAKNFFSFLIIVALLVQAAGFMMLYFWGTEINADEIIHYQQSPENMFMGDQAQFWRNILIWAFPVSKLFALFSGSMLVLTIMFASVIALTGGGTGILYFVSAFLWSLFVLALLSPWQNILRGGLFSGALYNLDELRAYMLKIELMTSGGEKPGFLEQLKFFARFLGYPAVSLLVLITTLIKYAKGNKQLTKAPKKEAAFPTPPHI